MKKVETTKQNSGEFDYISSPIELIYDQLHTSPMGLSETEAKARLAIYGYNEPVLKKKHTILYQILSKFLNPLVIILLIIGTFSLFFGEKISACFVFLMVLISVGLSFIQEFRSEREVEKLKRLVHTTATVYRDGKSLEIDFRELVPGDIIYISAGDMIPADIRLITAKDLFINQATLTGESLPVEKTAVPIQPPPSSLIEWNNIAFMGSSVVSGTGLGVVIKTGGETQFGELARRLATRREETSFDKGIRNFTYLMIRFMIILVIVIFTINAIFKGNLIEAFLFSLAVSVGLTPEMLPLLVTLNLSKGAMRLSKKKVIVKRLNSIQNLGAMDVLCTDKTGTLTIDRVVLERHCDIVRREDEEVLKYAYINSFYQTGLKNLLDQAILRHKEIVLENLKKIDEIPFDFSRKIMSVVVTNNGKTQLIAKGAPEEIFKRCTKFELDGELYDIE
ncbi:MAG: HAD-IC family P-type ATPase, partial [Candidatus Sumerlaeia bacterium]|nr:HAD-IC family P-type ATPase [Candidatus Sumerlaeia bacterium]